MHTYAYDPLFVNVNVKLRPLSRLPESKLFDDDVTVWATESSFFQRTVAPTGTLIVLGENAKSFMLTMYGEAAGDGAGA